MSFLLSEAENARRHRAIVQRARAQRWTENAQDVLDCADMLVAYLSAGSCKRAPQPGIEGLSRQWRGEWKRFPYRQAIRRAMYLLGVRRGQRGKMRLPPNWKERIREAGIDWETMSIVAGEELKWARAWKQFCDFDSYTSERQRKGNALGEAAPWPPPEIGWEARANSKKMRGKGKAQQQQESGQGEELAQEEGSKAKAKGYDVTRAFRKRIGMRVEE